LPTYFAFREPGRVGGAWWCILFGAMGAVSWIPLVLAGMFNVLR